MSSLLGKSWPLIPIQLALHYLNLVDTPAHARYHYFDDSLDETYEYVDYNAVVPVMDNEFGEQHSVAFLIGLLIMLHPFPRVLFKRFFRSLLGFWRWATTVSPKSSVELQRDAALQQVAELKEQLREKNELFVYAYKEGKKWFNGFYDLLNGANFVVQEYNALADKYEIIRKRSAYQTHLMIEFSGVLRLDPNEWAQLDRLHQMALMKGVSENFVIDLNFDDKVQRAQCFNDLAYADAAAGQETTPQQQESNVGTEQQETVSDQAAEQSGPPVDQEPEMEGGEDEHQDPEHDTARCDGLAFNDLLDEGDSFLGSDEEL